MAKSKRPGGVPPIEHRFKPGQSGNPGGRPKKQPTLRETTQERLARPVWVLVEGKRQQVPLRDALVDKALSAIADDPENFVRFARWLDGDRPPADTDTPTTVPEEDLAIIRNSLERIADGSLDVEAPDE
jgi:hypothetical protein